MVAKIYVNTLYLNDVKNNTNSNYYLFSTSSLHYVQKTVSYIFVNTTSIEEKLIRRVYICDLIFPCYKVQYKII